MLRLACRKPKAATAACQIRALHAIVHIEQTLRSALKLLANGMISVKIDEWETMKPLINCKFSIPKSVDVVFAQPLKSIRDSLFASLLAKW